MAHGNLNNTVKAFDVFFKNVSPEDMKGRRMDIKQQMKLSKTLYKKGMSRETH
jgi:hypothetical protein